MSVPTSSSSSDSGPTPAAASVKRTPTLAEIKDLIQEAILADRRSRDPPLDSSMLVISYIIRFGDKLSRYVAY